MKRFALHNLLLLTGCLLSVSLFSQKQKILLEHIAVSVSSLTTSTDFYTTVLQLDTIPEPFHDGKHTWLNVGHSQLHLIENDAVIKEPLKKNHLCFSVSSIDNFIQTLIQNKVEYEDWPGKKNAVTKRTDGVSQIYFKDPDGYWIEINDAAK